MIMSGRIQYVKQTLLKIQAHFSLRLLIFQRDKSYVNADFQQSFVQYLSSRYRIMAILQSIFKFVLRHVFRYSKQKVGDTITNIDIVTSFIQHFRNFKKFPYSSLTPPNQQVLFPLPNRWTNSQYKKSLQAPHLLAMQVSYTVGIPADQEKGNIILKAKDRSLTNLRLMQNLRFTDPVDSQTIHKVASVMFNDVRYNIGKELTVGDSLVNGQNPYLLRKFSPNLQEYFFGINSKRIEHRYQQKIKQAFVNEEYNEENLKELGLTKNDVIDRIQKGENVYSMYFQHLEELTKGQPLEHTPNILYGNQEIRQKHYLQSPYPIFIKANKNERDQGWICIAIAFRYKKDEITVFSPLFNRQPYKVWKLATFQLLQAYYNDFHLRVHLGLLHLTTVQYNVPMYNAITPLPRWSDQYKRMNYFLDQAFTLFNDGLEQVNLTGTQTLLHPTVEYSLLNKVFNLSRESALTLMANYSNNLDMTKVNPLHFIKQNGLTREEVDSNFDQMSLSMQLNQIIEQYVDKMYDLCLLKEDQDLFFQQINREVPNMGVGNYYLERRHRPMLQQPADLRKLVKNLAFCWCAFHAHTFTTMPFAQYWDFRPSMLKKAVPQTQSEWEKLVEGTEIPHSKVLMSSSQLIGGVSGKDPDNMLVNQMSKKYLQLQAHLAETEDPSERFFIQQRKQIYQDTYNKLIEYGKNVQKINEERKQKGLPQLTWMHPATLLASLNI